MSDWTMCERCGESVPETAPATPGDLNSPRWCESCRVVDSWMTYRQIVDALAGAGFEARQTDMAGNVAALTVTVSDDGRVWSGVVIGNGEWTMGETLDEPVWEGFVSVCPERDGEYVDFPDTGVYYVECGTVGEVVSAVRRAVSVLTVGE